MLSYYIQKRVKMQNNNRIIKKMFEGSLMVIILTTITTTLGMLVDGIVIGNFLGVDAMAAYGIVSPAFIVSAAVGGIFSSGCQTLTASSLSNGKFEKANGIFSLTCVLGLIISVLIMAVFLIFAAPISMALGASGEAAYLLPEAQGYLAGLAIGMPGIILTSCLQCVMQLDNDGKRAVTAVVVMTVFNVAGDLLVAIVLNGGMFGMAMATSLSYYAAIVVLALHFTKKTARIKMQVNNIAWKEAGTLFSTGLPTAVSRICTTLRTLVLNRLLLGIAGSVAIAAFSVQSNMNNLFGSVGPGIGMTVLLLSGVIVGEKDRSSTKGLLRTALTEGFGIVCIIAVVVFAAAPFFVGLYVSGEPETFDMAVSCVRFFALSMPVHAVNAVFINYLQGSRNLALSHTVCIMNEFAMVVICAVILGNIFGVNGVWISFLVGRLITLLMIVIFAAVRSKRFPRSLDDFLFLPADFDVPEDDKLEAAASNMDEVINVSKAAYDFCERKNIDMKRGYYISLCIEEMAGNIIRHGFSDGKRHSIQIRMIYKEGELILRIRDDCAMFDPKQWYEIHKPEDKTANIGIRLVCSVAKDFRYINTMRMNNLIIKI